MTRPPTARDLHRAIRLEAAARDLHRAIRLEDARRAALGQRKRTPDLRRPIAVAAAVLAVALATLFIVDRAAGQSPTTPTAREQALADQLKTEREKGRQAIRRARAVGYAQGRRSIILRTNTEHLVRLVAIGFGNDPDRAVTRAKCESGHAMSPTAGNGQFIGVYQIGTRGRGSMWQRAAQDFIAAGIGPTDALANIIVAHRYAAAHGWGEWECGGWSHR